jgi:hypothetical protein
MSKYTITHSTELMQNYLQATTMKPEKDFRALQTADGGALLFSIGSDDSFNVTAESSGKSHRWNPAVSLSKDYPGLQCQRFAVAQRANGAIYMAMVLRETKNKISNDHLYLGYLNLSKSGDVNPPTWNAYPYDDPKTARVKVEIAGIFISEATNGEYIVADVVRDPESVTREVVRYYVDRAKSDGHAWHQHDVPVDIEAEKYTSVLGRKNGAGVDGIYTSGQIDGSPQMIYMPLYNELRRDHHPLSSNLKLTVGGDLVADAIAVCPNPDNTTDLYGTAKGVLYRFDSALQKNNDNDVIATVATGNPLFNGVKDLFAFAYKDGVTQTDFVMVWGRNADNEIFYTTCPRGKQDTPGAWSVPLPIMSGVQQVAPFVNLANSANTFFAHSEGNVVKIAVKSPGKISHWNVSDIHLPPPSGKVKAKSFKSYTTHVKVVGANNQPIRNEKIRISAENITSVYINHLHYVVGPTPIQVDPDPTGSVTLVETAQRLEGTQFCVSVVGDDGDFKSIKPMQDASTVTKRLQTLKKPDLLVDATIHYQNEKIKPPKKLVRDAKRKANDPDVIAAAANIDYLWKAHDQLTNETRNSALIDIPAERLAAYKRFVGDKVPVLVDAGDMLSVLEASKMPVVFARHRGVTLVSGESWWEVFVHWIEGAWQFVLKIGEAIFAFVIEVIEDVYAAFKYVFNKIVETIEDIIAFVEFLFDVDDLRRTKEVFKHVTTLFLKDQIDTLSEIRQDFDNWVNARIQEINQWANLKEDQYDSINLLTRKPNQMPTESQSASASDSFLSYHFLNNLQDASLEGGGGGLNGASPHLAKLAGIVEQEINAVKKAAQDLYNLLKHAEETEVVDLLKGLVGIFADVVLSSFKALIDALLVLLETLAQEALQAFQEPIYIPVISEILEAFGIEQFSALDVLSWVAAIPATLGYKVIKNEAPFADNELTRFLSQEAPDFKAVVKRLQTASQPVMALTDGVNANMAFERTGDSPTVVDPMAKVVSGLMHLGSGALALVAGGAGLLEISYLKAGIKIPTGMKFLTAGSGLLSASLRFAINLAGPHAPFKNSDAGKAATSFNALSLVQKLVFIPIPFETKYFAYAGFIADGVLMVGQFGTMIAHFVEIDHAKPFKHGENLAIVDEVSGIFNWGARIGRGVLASDFVKDPESAAVVTAIFVTMRVIQGGLQIGEGITEWAAHETV